MAGKSKVVYICNQCGYESSKWNGKCPSCGEWNTFEEQEAAPVQTRSSLRNSAPIGTMDLS